MKRTAYTSLLVALLSLGMTAPASARLGDADVVPAATLLLPYFEVDLTDSRGANTTFWVHNTSDEGVVTQVTLWTDWGVPTFSFHIYLGPLEGQEVNMQRIFNKGLLPQTTQTDTTWPGCDGGFLPPVHIRPDEFGNLISVPVLRARHSGRVDPSQGTCWGQDHGDEVARGFVTVDQVNVCDLSLPSESSYFYGTAGDRNVLWGEYRFEIPVYDLGMRDPMVHIEAFTAASNYIPEYTFYRRFVFDGEDGREPLPNRWSARFVGGFFGSAWMMVWREPPSAQAYPIGCGSAPDWWPMTQNDFLFFDELANAYIPPPSGSLPLPFRNVAQRVPLVSNEFGFPPESGIPDFGWLYTDLRTGGFEYEAAQSWMTTVVGLGFFSVGSSAIPIGDTFNGP